jgi:CRP-like cAMP-binding protein/membrane protease YdiL (CAAX protease family)
METKDSIIDFLQSNPIAKDLSSLELDLLYQLNKILYLDAQTIVFTESESTRDIYFIFKGEVEILKWDKGQHLQLTIGKIKQGEMFGEMSFLDGEPRSSSIKTIKPSILIELSYEMIFQKMDDPAVKNIYNKIIQNIAITNTQRLRVSNKNYVQSLRTEIDQLSVQNSSGFLFISIIFIMGLANIADTIILKSSINVHSVPFSWSFLMGIFIPILFIAKKINHTLDDLGVTLSKWKKSVSEGLIISGGLLSFLFFGYWIYTLIEPTAPSLIYVITHPLKRLDFSAYIYIIHCYIQEFIARGTIQSSLLKFMGTNTRPSEAVIVASFLFGFFHSSRGVEAVVVAFLASLFFGFIYIRTNNLLGVSIVHYVVGIVAIHYLGLI